MIPTVESIFCDCMGGLRDKNLKLSELQLSGSLWVFNRRKKDDHFTI